MKPFPPKINPERVTSPSDINMNEKLAPVVVRTTNETLPLDRSKGFVIFFFFRTFVWEKINLILIKCALSFNMTFAFIIIYYRIFHIASRRLAPPEYNIKVKGSLALIPVHISSGEKSPTPDVISLLFAFVPVDPLT